MMAFPQTWASVLLDHTPIDVEEAARMVSSLGLHATTTRDGWLALPGGFLARIDATPYPSDLLHHPGAIDVPERATAAVLHISGGGSDSDRQMLTTLTQLRVTTGEAPSKSSRFRKVEALASWLPQLSTLGPGVVLPLSAHRFVPWSSWPATEAGEVFGAFVTLGRAGSVVCTRGLAIFAVSEVACPVPAGVDADTFHALTRNVFDAAFEVAWQGFSPDGEAVLTPVVDAKLSPWRLLRATSTSLWLGDDRAPSLWSWILRSNAEAVFAAPALFDDPDARMKSDQTGVQIAVHGARDDLESPRRALTVGLSQLPRAEGPIELVTTSPRASRVAAVALLAIAELVRSNPDRMNRYDRVAVADLEPYGLAGVVLWASGSIRVGSQTVELWDLLPVTPDELARFRAGEQGAWMDEVEQANAFDQLQARWTIAHA